MQEVGSAFCFLASLHHLPEFRTVSPRSRCYAACPPPFPSFPSNSMKLTIVSSRFDQAALYLGQLKVRVEEADVGCRRGSRGRARMARGGRCAAG